MATKRKARRCDPRGAREHDKIARRIKLAASFSSWYNSRFESHSFKTITPMRKASFFSWVEMRLELPPQRLGPDHKQITDQNLSHHK
jgi:hypothetical protein